MRTALLTVFIFLSSCTLSLTPDIKPPPDTRLPEPQATSTLEHTSPGFTSGEAVPEAIGAENQEEQAAPGTTAAVPEETTEEENELTITGEVQHAGGGDIPDNLLITLNGFDGMVSNPIAATDILPDGSYSFEGIEPSEAQVFFTSTEYQGEVFISTVLHTNAAAAEDDMHLVISLFETTSDVSDLVIERMHVLLEFSSQDVLQVMQLFVVSNPGNHVIIPVETGEAIPNFDLPEDAINLQVEDDTDGNRFIITEKGIGDTESLQPGRSTQVLFAYEIPYKPKGLPGARKQTLNIHLPLAVEKAIVMAPDDTMRLQGEMLHESDMQNMQGVNIQVYEAGGLEAGSNLEITVASKLPTGHSAEETPGTSLIAGAIAFGLALIIAGVWFYRRTLNEQEDAEVESAGTASNHQVLDTQESVLDAILALDDLYRAGEIPQAAYQERRTELKAHLRAMRDGD